MDGQIALQTGTAGLTGNAALPGHRLKDIASGTVDSDDRVIYHRDTERH